MMVGTDYVTRGALARLDWERMEAGRALSELGIDCAGAGWCMVARSGGREYSAVPYGGGWALSCYDPQADDVVWTGTAGPGELLDVLGDPAGGQPGGANEEDAVSLTVPGEVLDAIADAWAERRGSAIDPRAARAGVRSVAARLLTPDGISAAFDDGEIDAAADAALRSRLEWMVASLDREAVWEAARASLEGASRGSEVELAVARELTGSRPALLRFARSADSARPRGRWGDAEAAEALGTAAADEAARIAAAVRTEIGHGPAAPAAAAPLDAASPAEEAGTGAAAPAKGRKARKRGL